VSVDGDRIVVATARARDVAVAVPTVARAIDARLLEVRPMDDSLESLFREVVRT
jgi:hypothetical protein